MVPSRPNHSPEPRASARAVSRTNPEPRAKWKPDLSGARAETPRRRPSSSTRLAQASGVFLFLVLVTCLGTLPDTLRWYNAQELDRAVRHAPSMSPVVPYAHFQSGAKRDVHRKTARAPDKSGWQSARGSALYRTSSWFGHDDLGRSLLFRVLPGTLVSLAIGLSAAFVAVVIGATWGAVAGLLGGRIDRVLMRVVDVLYGLPYILMVILLKIALTQPLTALFGGRSKAADIVILFLAIGGVSWLTMARVIRGQVLSLKTRPYVEAARVAGAGPLYILRRHLLPNLMGPIVTYATLVIPQAILQESFLSFLGIGVQQPTPSLGRLAADGVQAVNTFVGYWWLIVFPCAVLISTLLALNFIGDALRDRFDPKSSAATLV